MLEPALGSKSLFSKIVCLVVVLANPAPPLPRDRVRPVAVTVRGYQGGDLMEPALSPDGRFLFFNDSNHPGVDTELHWARRLRDDLFDYQGRLTGVSSPVLEGVASLDRLGNLYFISPRSYAQTFNTVYRVRFDSGTETPPALVPGLQCSKPGQVVFDVEVHPGGQELVLSEGWFQGGALPQSADLALARRTGAGFERTKTSPFALLNLPETLEYAPALSSDGLQLYFTRLTPGGKPEIFHSRRTRPDQPFQAASRVNGLQGYVEGPAFSADQSKVYYHSREPAGFRLFYFLRSTRMTAPVQR